MRQGERERPIELATLNEPESGGDKARDLLHRPRGDSLVGHASESATNMQEEKNADGCVERHGD